MAVRGGRERGAVQLPHVGWAGAVNSAHERINFLFFFQGIFQIHRSEINLGKKYLGTSVKYEISHGGRFKYLAQVLYLAL
jgi:hypothetical protein